MSAQALRWAFANPIVGDAGAQLTLVALAHCHNGETGLCCPSQDFLAAMTGRSVDSIQRDLKVIEKQKLAKRERRYKDGYRTSDRHVLALDLTPQRRGVSSDLTPQTEEAYTAKDPHLTPHSRGVHKDEQEEQEIREREAAPAALAPSHVDLSSKRSTSSELPTGWQPSKADIEYATNAGATEHATKVEAEKFRLHYQATPKRSANWSAAWRKWVIGSLEHAGRQIVLPGEKPHNAMANKKWLDADTPQWIAWDKYFRARGSLASQYDYRPDGPYARIRRGAYFDSEWPPGHQQEAVAVAKAA